MVVDCKFNFIHRLFGAVLVIFYLIFGWTSSASAIPMLMISEFESDGSTLITSVTISDGNADGVITANEMLSAYDVVVSVGTTKPAVGSSAQPSLEIGSIAISSAGTTDHVLEVKFFEDGFTPIPSGVNFISSVSATNTLGGPLTYNTYFDDTAPFDPFSQTTLISSLGLSSAGEISDFGASLPALAPYSLTQVVRLTHSTGTATNFNASLGVPIPSSAIFFGVGFAGFLAWRWKYENLAD